MTNGSEDSANELVRTQEFEVSGPIELDVSNNLGPVEITLTDSDHAHVHVRHDPTSSQPDWRSGLSGLLNWVSEQIAESGIKPGGERGAADTSGKRERPLAEANSEAVHQTRIDMTGSRLAVHPPTSVPLRTVPLSITVEAPADSQVGVRTGSGAVAVTGRAGKMHIQTGSGAVTTDETAGSASVRTGSGRLHLGTMLGGVQARSGSGAIEIATVQAGSSVVTGSGDVWIGAVADDVLVRSGSGNISVADAGGGQVELITGSGDLRVAVRKGVTAEVDLTSSVSSARSELEVSNEPPAEQVPLKVYGRTGSGEALITSAL